MPISPPPRTSPPVRTSAPARTGPPLLTIDRISKTIGGKPVLQTISLKLYRNEIVTIIGPNGAGKTTLVKLVLGLLAPDGGRITRQPGIKTGYVPQKIAIDPALPISVWRFITLVHRPPAARLHQVLAETGIAHLEAAQMQNLSGGELQRVLLARALVGRPDLLVLDEPVQGVDYAGEAALYDLISQLRSHHNIGVLMISHDLHVVLGDSDRIICLNRHICCSGVPEAVTRHPEYQRLFGPDLGHSYGLYQHHHDHVHDLTGDVVSRRDHRHDNNKD